MRFETVNAFAFGPFGNAKLELAPAMNVVYGPNESGKSTWHAALYAGLCGVRRAKGRQLRDDAAFADLHRPWGNNTRWDVGVILVLDDGRRVEMRHDLAGGVDSSARDADIAGRDYSYEILNEGSPDGARWLGLTRRSFVLTACIRQAQILRLLDSPAGLQTELQLAADTSDRDGTAGEALVRLLEFRADSVGSERAPIKPLRMSRDRAHRAQRQLEEARVKHEEYLDCWLEVDRLEQLARRQEQVLAVMRAPRAAATANEAASRLQEALKLNAHFPEGPPRRPSQDEALVRQVASAIARWNQRPTVNEPEGVAISTLEARLSEIDLLMAVKAEVNAGEFERRLAKARELANRFPNGRPQNLGHDDQLSLRIESALTAWELSPFVTEPEGPAIAELEQELADVDAKLRVSGAPQAHESPSPALGLWARLFRSIRSCFSALLRLLSGRGGESPLRGEMRQTLEARRELLQQRVAARVASEQQWKQDAQRASEAADAILGAAEDAGFRAENPEAAAEWLVEWQQRRIERRADIEPQLNEWEELQNTLGGTGLDELGRQAAGARDEASSSAARVEPLALRAALAAPDLEASKRQVNLENRLAVRHDLQERRRQEREYTEAVASEALAEEELAEAARLAGVVGMGPEEKLASLLSWQNDRIVELEVADLRMEKWEELQRTLGQDTLEELSRKVESLNSEARDLSDQVGIGDFTQLPVAPTPVDFSAAELEAQEARTSFDRAESQLEILARSIPNVAEAEEELAAARSKSERVQSLDRTLELTIDFLEKAQERVHRSVAPILANTVREWLPRVTGGRYIDCRMDPKSLAVEVSALGGRWQRVELLSHGTAEQVYLLLRLALSRHLTSQSCPLILDDAVAASDSQRKHDLLETILAISESTQVILFTHESDVREWAAVRLVGSPNKLTDLDFANSLS